MGKKQMQALEDALGSVALALPKENGEDRLHFHAEMYPYLQWRYKEAKADVAKLGMTEVVETAIRDCMVLVKQGRRIEAQRLLNGASRALGEKSGTFDEMRRMYTASNDSKLT